MIRALFAHTTCILQTESLLKTILDGTIQKNLSLTGFTKTSS